MMTPARRITTCRASCKTPIITNVKKLLDRSLFDSIVHIKVGPSKRDFGIHRALLCNVSSYFNAALTGDFKEAQTGVINFDEENPETFSRFNGWLYTRILLDDEEMNEVDSFAVLADLYVFAEERIIPSLQNVIIDTMLRLSENTTTSFVVTTIQKLWTGTAPSSTIRKLAVDQLVYWADCQDIMSFDFPPEFVAAVVRGLYSVLWKNVGDPVPSSQDLEHYYKWDMWENRCTKYHIHELNEPVCKDSM